MKISTRALTWYMKMKKILLVLLLPILSGCCIFGTFETEETVYGIPGRPLSSSGRIVAGCDREAERLTEQSRQEFLAEARRECALPQPYGDYDVADPYTGELVSDDKVRAQMIEQAARRNCSLLAGLPDETASYEFYRNCPDCRHYPEQCYRDHGLEPRKRSVKMCSPMNLF